MSGATGKEFTPHDEEDSLSGRLKGSWKRNKRKNLFNLPEVLRGIASKRWKREETDAIPQDNLPSLINPQILFGLLFSIPQIRFGGLLIKRQEVEKFLEKMNSKYTGL